MKRLLITIVAFVYLTSVIGISLQQHYCMNKLVSWSFFLEDKDLCDKCGMEKDGKQNGCCEDVQVKVKNENDQFKSFLSIVFEKKESQSEQNFFVYEPGWKLLFSEKQVADHGPPYHASVSLFILNRVFLI